MMPPTATSRRAVGYKRSMDRFVTGAILALALFLVGAGIGEIALARNAACLQGGDPARWGQATTRQSCMTDIELAAARGLARGIGGVLFPQSSSFVAWGFSGILYALIGGVCAQLATGWAVGSYLFIQVILLGAITLLRYIATYVTY